MSMQDIRDTNVTPPGFLSRFVVAPALFMMLLASVLGVPSALGYGLHTLYKSYYRPPDVLSRLPEAERRLERQSDQLKETRSQIRTARQEFCKTASELEELSRELKGTQDAGTDPTNTGSTNQSSH